MKPFLPWVLMGLAMLDGCVTASVDEMTFDAPTAGMSDGSLVVLGRRHAPDYDTEPDFIDCIGGHISRGSEGINVIPERQFVDSLYPWFEPRTAPLSIESVGRLMVLPTIASRLQELNVSYMVWIDGRTQDTNSSGSMTCGVGPTGAGCFGFGTWGTESEYEATWSRLSVRKATARSWLAWKSMRKALRLVAASDSVRSTFSMSCRAKG